MTRAFKPAALVAALLLGASVGAADAMPVAPAMAGLSPAGAEASAPIAVAYRRSYSRRYHHSRRYRSRRMIPSRACQKAPSRC